MQRRFILPDGKQLQTNNEELSIQDVRPGCLMRLLLVQCALCTLLMPSCLDRTQQHYMKPRVQAKTLIALLPAAWHRGRRSDRSYGGADRRSGRRGEACAAASHGGVCLLAPCPMLALVCMLGYSASPVHSASELQHKHV